MLKQIRKKDIAIIIVLIAISLISVVGCQSKIQESSEERKAKIRTAVKVTSDDLFDYSLETRQGNIVATGKVEAVDPVKFEEMNQEFLYVEKTKEHYVMKTRVVSYTDADGKTKTKTETYWEWDTVSTDHLKSSDVMVLSKKYPSDMFKLPYSKNIDAENILDKGDFRYGYIYLKSDVRVSYDVIPKSYETTFIAKAGDKGLESIDKNKIYLGNTNYQSFMDKELKDSWFDKFIFIIILITIPIAVTVIYFKMGVFDDYYTRRKF